MNKYKQLSYEERQSIYFYLSLGYSRKKIAEKLSRSVPTISREIKRNSSIISPRHNGMWREHKTTDMYHYLPDSAQSKRNKRRRAANWRAPLKNITVFHYVTQKLREWWSPDIIAWSLKNLHPENPVYWISHECIYQFIYSKHGEELRLKYHLTRKHKRRKKKTGRSLKKIQHIPNRRDITERDSLFLHLKEREEFWHFEGDSILSRRSTLSALRTEVERKSRFIFCEKIQRKTAEYTEIATIKIFSSLPKNSIKSTTWDNGTEHMRHEYITQYTGVQIFFADPYKSWQRWTNEHANGMLRRFFPKGTNFDDITQDEIQRVVDYINNRPRKILGYRTPKEVFEEELEKLSKK